MVNTLVYLSSLINNSITSQMLFWNKYDAFDFAASSKKGPFSLLVNLSTFLKCLQKITPTCPRLPYALKRRACTQIAVSLVACGKFLANVLKIIIMDILMITWKNDVFFCWYNVLIHFNYVIIIIIVDIFIIRSVWCGFKFSFFNFFFIKVDFIFRKV